MTLGQIGMHFESARASLVEAFSIFRVISELHVFFCIDDIRKNVRRCRSECNDIHVLESTGVDQNDKPASL